MVKTYFKQLKAFLALEVRNLDSFIALVLPSLTDFLFYGLLDLVNFLINLFYLSPPLLPPTISLLLVPKADTTGNPIIFNIEVSSAAILLKS